MINGFVEVLVRYRLICTLLFFGVVGAAGYGVQFFELDASADTLIQKDDPIYIETRIVSHKFSPNETMVVAFQPKKRDMFHPQTIKELDKLIKEIKTIPRVESVISVLNAPVFDPKLIRINLTEIKLPTIEDHSLPLNKARKFFRESLFYRDLVIGANKTSGALQITMKGSRELAELNAKLVEIESKMLDGKLSKRDQLKREDLSNQVGLIEDEIDMVRIKEITQIKEIINNTDNIDYYLGGVYVLAYELMNIIRNDLKIFGIGMIGLISFLLLVLFRQLRWVLVPVIICASALTITVGVFGFLGFKVTLVSSNFISLQLILTMAIVIHYLVEFILFSQDKPESTVTDRLQHVITSKLSPSIYAVITTSIGFGSLLYSDFIPVISFGWMMTISVIISLLTATIGFPLLLSWFNAKRPWSLGIQEPLAHAMAYVAIKGRWLIVLLGIAAMVFGIEGVKKLTVENSFISYFDTDTEVYENFTFIDKNIGGSTPLDVVYKLPRSSKGDVTRLFNQENVNQIYNIHDFLAAQNGVGKVTSLADAFDLLAIIADYRLVTEQELTLLYWALPPDIKNGLLSPYFHQKDNEIRFSVRIKDSTEGLERNKLLTDIKQGLSKMGIDEDRLTFSNLFVLYNDMLQQLFRSQILTLGIVLGAIMIAFLFIFQSLKIALIGIIPNTISILVVMGVMGYKQIPMDLMTITIASISMGIAVDDTIHYIHRYLFETQTHNRRQAVRNAHKTVGFAMIYTSLIIISGFSILILSDFIPSVYFGVLTSIAMGVALMVSLFLLPALLLIFKVDENPQAGLEEAQE